jgi:diguanylate cyclase (GGDEF)-like protein
MPNPGADRRQNLSLLVDSPPYCKSAGLPVVMSTEDLAKWGASAAQYSGDQAKEIKQITIAMEAGAAAVGERDQRSSQFHGLTTRLSSSSWPLLTSATELHTVVKKMAEEVDQLLSELRAEVANYRARLAQLEKREAVDLLTGLANRREVEAQIEERISWKSVFCLAILDLNGFKRINDIHGHVAGDNLLKQFAGRLKSPIRASDVVGRWGGDEFIVVVDAGFEEAQIRLDRIRKFASGDYTISNGTDLVQVTMTASIGIAEWDGKETAVELLARADKCMYSEKKLKDVHAEDALTGRARSVRRTSQIRRPRQVGHSTVASRQLK